MARRNGTDILKSEVEVWHDGHGSFDVVSVVVTAEYRGCSRDFANFLAKELRETGTIYPKPDAQTIGVFDE